MTTSPRTNSISMLRFEVCENKIIYCPKKASDFQAYPNYLLISLFINFSRCYNFFRVPEDHIKVLVECLFKTSARISHENGHYMEFPS